MLVPFSFSFSFSFFWFSFFFKFFFSFFLGISRPSNGRAKEKFIISSSSFSSGCFLSSLILFFSEKYLSCFRVGFFCSSSSKSIDSFFSLILLLLISFDSLLFFSYCLISFFSEEISGILKEKVVVFSFLSNLISLLLILLSLLICKFLPETNPRYFIFL